MNQQEIIKTLNELYENALQIYNENKNDFDAGRVDGIKQAIEKIRGM